MIVLSKPLVTLMRPPLEFRNRLTALNAHVHQRSMTCPVVQTVDDTFSINISVFDALFYIEIKYVI